MKKIVMFCLLAAFSLASVAQLPVIVKAGYGKSNWQGDAVSNADAMYAWKVGVGTEFHLYKGFFIQPMLYYVNEGTTLNETSTSSTTGSIRVVEHQNYVQLPVMLLYRCPISPKVSIVSSIGPYAAYGVYGKQRTSITLSGSTTTTTVNTFDDGGVEKFDAGLNAGFGFEFDQMMVGAEVQVGMLDNVKNANSRNIAAFLTLGYKF